MKQFAGILPIGDRWQGLFRAFAFPQLLLVLTVGSIAPLVACEPDASICVIAKKYPDHVDIVLESPEALEAAVRISGTLDNATANKRLPVDVNVQNSKHSQVLLTVRAIDKAKPYTVRWRADWKAGIPGGKHDDRHIYRMPYNSPKQSFSIMQGRGGEYSHRWGTEDENAIDFDMPVGTLILATRAGRIIALRQNSNEGGRFGRFLPCANYLVVKHDDGTYAKYVHLQYNSALVKVGDQVKDLQPLARSGRTGMAAYPHLHFDVYTVIDGAHRKTLPVQFLTKDGVKTDLKENWFY